jgi:UDP-glucose 4-epimerase
MKKILVTGGAGFIGSHTVDLLLQSGFKVIVLDDLSTGKITNLDLFNTNLEFIPGDVLDSSKLLTQVKRADAVLHLAALPSVARSIEEPLLSLQINTQGFLQVLEAIRHAQKPVRLVYASSAAIYGNATELPCRDESHMPANPVLSPYAMDKANNERYATLYANLYGVPSLGLRYFNVYGPRQDAKSSYAGVIAKFIENYKKREELTILGDGAQSRDFIYVGDVAQANLLALQSEVTGAMNVATGVPETLLQLVKYIEQAGGTPAQLDFAAERAGDIRESYASVQKAERELAFRYKIDLASGIKVMLV